MQWSKYYLTASQNNFGPDFQPNGKQNICCWSVHLCIVLVWDV